MKVYSQQIILSYLESIKLEAELVHDLLKMTDAHYPCNIEAEIRNVERLIKTTTYAIENVKSDSFEPSDLYSPKEIA
jgi:hypothetical protein